jgi:hypothetical protein
MLNFSLFFHFITMPRSNKKIKYGQNDHLYPIEKRIKQPYVLLRFSRHYNLAISNSKSKPLNSKSKH